MADAQANLNINIDTSSAIGQIKALQSQISQLYATMATGGATARAESAKLTQNLLNSVNATGKFSASMTTLSSSANSFTNSLEKNKLSMGEYFRYAGGASKTFGRLFTSEFNTIEKVARERVKTLQTQYIKMGRDANGAIQGIAVRPLSLDMKNLGTQVMMTAQKQQIFNQLLKQGTTNLLNFGKNTQWAGRQLMVGFTIPLTILGTTAARVFMELEEQTIRFKRVYGEFSTSAEEVDKMAKKLKDLAGEFTKYGVAVKDTLAMAADAAAMGKMGNDLIAQVEQASRLAVLGGVEQQQALETTISLTNAFGVATEDLAGKISFLNAVENQTVVSIEDLTIAIPKAGPVVQQLGGDVEDLAFFLTAMKEGGINASEGANALKSGLASLINPSAKASEMLAGLGININSIVEGNAGNVKGIVIDFAKALDTLDPLNRARAIEQLFGKFQFSRISTLFQNVIAQGSQASRVLELTGATTQELAILAERELARVEESTGYKFKKSIEDVTAALAPVGEEFLKAVTPFIEFATKILNGFNNLGDGAKQFAVIAIAAVGVVAPTFLMLFGLVANGFANFVKGISVVGSFLGRLSGQTKIVGGGINYMTQEQLESAAVAASLEQVHQRLVQLFTSEAGTVDRLAAAYMRAVPALRNFNAAAGGAAASGTTRYNPFLPPKKYADGVTMVPGPKGKGDIVPAMLTPGEAVIPADQTAKYFPLIKGIIADNIPGYQDSNVSNISSRIASSGISEEKLLKIDATINKLVKSLGAEKVEAALSNLAGKIESNAALLKTEQYQQVSRERFDSIRKSDFAHVGGDVRMKPADMMADPSYKAMTKSQQQIIQDAAQYAPDTNVRATHGYGYKLKGRLNTALNVQEGQTKGANASEVVQEFKDRGVSKFEDAIAYGGGDTSDAELMSEFKAYDKKLTDLLEEATKKKITQFVDTAEDKARLVAASGVDPSSVGVIEEYEAKAAAGMGEKASAVRARAKGRLRDIRINYTRAAQERILSASEQGDARATSLASQMGLERDAQGGLVKKKDKKVFEASAKPKTPVASLPGAKPEVDAKKDADSYTKTFEQTVESSGQDPYVSIRDRKSPHGLVPKDANSDAKAYSTQFNAGIKKNPLAPPPPPIAPNVTAGATGRFGKIKAGMASAGNRVTDALLGTSLGQKTAQYFADTSGANIVDSKGNVKATARSLEELNAKIDKLGKTSKSTAQQVDSATQDIDNAGENITRNTQSTNADRREAARQGRQRRSGVAAGVLGTATMAVGMATQVEGPIGEFAQKLLPVVGGLAVLGPILLALPGPLAAIIAVAGSMAATIFMLNKKFDDAQNKTVEFTRSLGASEKSLKSLAEFAGTVSSGELMDKVREDRLKLVTSATGKTTFGESFVESETGAAQVESAKVMLAETGSIDTVANALSTQLSTAIMSGIITPEQASSIASNIGFAMNNMELALKVRATITELVGPNGEDITGGKIVDFSAKVLDQGIADLSSQMEMAQANINSQAFGTKGERIGGSVGIIAGGAGAGAAAGAGIGAALGSVIPGAGTAVGAGAGLIIGSIAGGISSAVGAYYLMQDAAEEAGAATGAIVGQAMNLLDTQQELSDAFDAYYLKKIQEAKVQGDIAEAMRLQAEYEEKKVELSEQEIAMRSQLRTSLEQGGTAADAAREGIVSARDTRFEGDAAAQLILPSIDATLKRLQGAGEITQTDTDLINLELATTMDPGTLNALLAFVGEDGAKIDALVNIVGKFGGEFAGEAGNVLGLIGDESLKATIFTSISTSKNEQEAREVMDFVREIAKQKEIISTDYILNIMEKNPEAKENLDRIFEAVDIQEVKEVDQAYKINPKLQDAEAFDEAYFNMLPDADKEQYVKTISTILEMTPTQIVGDPNFLLWLGEKELSLPADGGGFSVPKLQKMFAEDMGVKVTTAMSSSDTTLGGEEEATPISSGGGGTPSSFLDAIVKQTRDFKSIQQGLTEGWDASLAAIKKFSSEGGDAFNGLSNQMRKVKVSEPLIEKILGMDADEYEKRKKEIFVFDVAGNIVELTAAGQAIQDALNTATIADFINEQQGITASVGNQVTALTRLTQAGASYEAAYRAVQNTALAAAIATAKSSVEIQAAAQAAMEAQKMMDKFEEINEEEQRKKRISEAIREMNKEFSNQAKILDYINKNRSKLSDAQISSILGNKDLQSLILEPKIDPKALQEALNNANKKAALELNIKKLTVEGQEDIFQTGLSAAMSAFSAKEQEIELAFKATIADDESLVKSAKDQLAKIDFELDDYQAALQEISWAEQKINDSYKDRFDALSKVSELNDQITASKARQLDLADALSRGDIAAAAKAAQEMRSQEQTNAIETQRTMMETAQQTEIARLRSSGGLSREQIDERILQLEKERFGIEENTLEPAQERIRLAELQRDLQITDLEVLGKTRDEWEAIGNRVDVAQANGWKFADAMQEALNIVETLVASLLNRPVEVEAPAPASSGGGGGGDNGAKAVVPTSPDPDTTKRAYDWTKDDTDNKRYDRDTQTAIDNILKLSSRETEKSRDEAMARRSTPTAPLKTSTMNQSLAQMVTSLYSAVAPKPTATRALTAPWAQPRTRANGGLISRMAMGGSVKGYPMGGLIPYKAEGGFFKSLGSDTVPAMLTPGEFVVRRPAVNKIGVDKLEKINRGTYEGNSVYNYNLEVNVKSGSNPNEIANTVMRSIKQVEGRRIRSTNYNG